MANGTAAQTSVAGSSTTPILLVGDSQDPDCVAWLTIELLPAASCGFHPDPLALGMTAVHGPSGNESRLRSFLSSLRRIWRNSGVFGDYRGRWKVTAKCPVKDPRFETTVPELPITLLTGRSAEASALAAIWAAAGRIPYAEPFEERGGLALDVAVSALVDKFPADNALTEARLKKAGNISRKLAVAELWGLDAVALVSSEEKSARKLETHKKIHIPSVNIMGHVMDALLVGNRTLRDWQKQVEQGWLGLWRGGTATPEAMGGSVS